MDFKNMGDFIDNGFMDTIHDIMEQLSEEVTEKQQHQHQHNPSHVYVRDKKAMARTPADIKDLPNAYEFIVDMPGVNPSEVKVQLEDNDNVLVVSGERKRDKDKGSENDQGGGVKYLRIERRAGKFMRKFVLPENVNVDNICAVCKDGVLVVTVEKLPPPQPKMPKTVEVQFG